MATDSPLAHFVGPDVLDPLFQQMRARGLAPREAQGRILEFLKREKLIILAHVAASVWSLQSRQFATREEEVQAQQEAWAATEKYDYDAYHAILFEQSPPPDGIIGPIEPESWEVTVIIAIRDGHLVIELLVPKFPPESYSFAIANPEAVDELLAAASPAHVSSAAVSSNPPVPEPPRPPDNAHAIEHVEWAVRVLRITGPDKLAGLRGKKLQKLVCNTVGPNFWCDQRTVQRGKKRAD
jgi:hypothetical protein